MPRLRRGSIVAEAGSAQGKLPRRGLISIKADRLLGRILLGLAWIRASVNGKLEKHTERKAGKLQPLGEAFLGMLERDQRRLLRLCAALERLADGLPESRIHGKTSRLLHFLNRAFERHIFLHEKCLFPLMRSLLPAHSPLEPVLNQLEYEHASDHGLVLELTSAFENSSRELAGSDIPMLGFLLRAFFENYRRHNVWENGILYPAARQLIYAHPHDALLRMSLGLDA
jgi:iron-sulfur cluster repair protein YtfE (RIC family)